MGRSPHDVLCDLGALWCLRLGCVVAMTETEVSGFGIADAVGFGIIAGKQRGILIEAKASRSDFKRDGKKWHRGRDGEGHYGISDRYYIAPPGMLAADEIPEPWGLLEPEQVDGSGRYTGVARVVKRCRYTEPDPAWWAHHFAIVAKVLTARWAMAELGTDTRLLPGVFIPGLPDELARALSPLRHTQRSGPSCSEDWSQMRTELVAR